MGHDEQRQDGQRQPERGPPVTIALLRCRLVPGRPPAEEPLQTGRALGEDGSIGTRRQIQVDQAGEQVARDDQGERAKER